jgi:hypothetical protein
VYRLAVIIVETALISGGDEFREGGIEASKVGLRSAACVGAEREEPGSLRIGDGKQEAAELVLALTCIEQAIA